MPKAQPHTFNCTVLIFFFTPAAQLGYEQPRALDLRLQTGTSGFFQTLPYVSFA